MRRFRRGVVAPSVAAMGGPPPSLATPTNIVSVIGDNSVNNVSTYTATFDANVAAGKKVTLILNTTALSGAVTITGADSAGNNWGSPVRTYTLNSRRQAVYECVLTNALVATSTTIPLATSASGRIYIVGLTADNIGALDTSNNGNSGTDVTFSVSTGALPAAPGLSASIAWKANGAAVTEDTGNGWTRLIEDNNPGAGTMTISTQVAATTTALTHAPAWIGSAAYAQIFLYWPGS